MYSIMWPYAVGGQRQHQVDHEAPSREYAGTSESFGTESVSFVKHGEKGGSASWSASHLAHRIQSSAFTPHSTYWAQDRVLSGHC